MASEKSKQFWGGASAVASIIPAVIGGVVHGTYNKITGEGTFNDGFEETSNKIIEGAEEFGQEHADVLTNTVIGTLGSLALKKGIDQIPSSHHNTPHKS